MTNEIKNFKLSIPFANSAARNKAKAMGATWNAAEKVWEIETTLYKLDNLKNLGKFIVSESAVKMVDSGCGFMMDNTTKNQEIVSKFGFDAIENI